MPATVWRGRIAFGMISIPVRMYKAARRERVKFHHVYRPEPEEAEEYEPAPPGPRPVPGPASHADEEDLPEASAPSPDLDSVSRVRQNIVTEDTGARVSRDAVLKGFEAEKGRYVVLKPAEIAALRPATSTELQLLQFTRLAEIDPIFFDASYYLAPDKGGEKPFALLVKALQKTGDVALGTFAMHGREHAVVIRAGKQGLMLHTLFYNNEVRSEEEWRGDLALATDKEVDLAARLVEAMEAPFDPAALKDGFEERLRELIATRTSVPASGSAPSAEKPGAPVIDIMEALKRSLAAARKPVQRDRGQTGAKSPRQKRSGS